MGLGATPYSTINYSPDACSCPPPPSCGSSTEGSREPMETAGCGGSVQLDECSPTSPDIPPLDDCPGKTSSGARSGIPERSTCYGSNYGRLQQIVRAAWVPPPGGSSSESDDSRLDVFEALADIGVILGEETAILRVLRLVGGAEAAVAPVRPPGLASKADGIEGRVDTGPFRFALRRSLPSVCCIVGCPSRPLELLTGPDDGNHVGHQFGDIVGVLRAQHPHVNGVAL